ncbi:diacylglycerol kinase family protein [soil metagenome]
MLPSPARRRPVAHDTDAPVVAGNATFHILLNAGSGHHDETDRRAVIESIFAAAGRRCVIRTIDDPAALPGMARDIVERASRDGDVVVAAGGDGTINAVAQAAVAGGCAFGVLPQGTFNYFGRTHSIPQELDAAARQLLESSPTPVQVGRVNDRVFLVNASLGLYPRLLEDREAYKRHYGRSRLVALWAGIVTIARGQRSLRIVVDLDGQPRKLKTPTVFIGNNRLQLEQIGISESTVVEQGQLAAILLAPVGPLVMLWLLMRGAFGRLGDARHVVNFAFRSLTVRPAHGYAVRRMKVATDGEVGWMHTPIEFSVSPKPLWLMLPRAPVST